MTAISGVIHKANGPNASAVNTAAAVCVCVFIGAVLSGVI